MNNILEFIPTVKLRFGNAGLYPFLLVGAGFDMEFGSGNVTASVNSVPYNSTYSDNWIVSPAVQGGVGLELQANDNLGMFVETRSRFIFTSDGETLILIFAEGGADFDL